LRRGRMWRTKLAEHGGYVLNNNFAKPLTPTGC
jgi:hypothetical protein